MTCEEAQELITALVDRELPDHERTSLESHLAECSHCRFAVEQEQLVKKLIHSRAERMHAPVDLRNRLLSDQRIFSERKPARWQDRLRPMPNLAALAVAAGLLFAVALPLISLFKSTKEPIAAATLESYELFARGQLSVRRVENPDEIVKQLTAAVGGHFHPMGYDFTAMGLRPVAGLVREIEGRKILVAIYEGPGGTLFCYTFFGSEEDAPMNSAKFFDPSKKISFYAFSRGPVNAVFHREGKVICILASEMPMDQLLALARSKATPS
jgi:anti-sigma factor (TIGR02949 family)